MTTATTINTTGISTTHYEKMSAAAQRAQFGAVPFGKIAFLHNAARGRFEVKLIVDFGRDYNIQHVSYEEVAKAIAENRVVKFRR